MKTLLGEPEKYGEKAINKRCRSALAREDHETTTIDAGFAIKIISFGTIKDKAFNGVKNWYVKGGSLEGFRNVKLC